RIALTPWGDTEYLLLADGAGLREFALERQESSAVLGRHGEGRRLTLSGRSASGIEKNVLIEMWQRYPGIASCRVSYRTLSRPSVTLRGWRNADVQLLPPAQAGGSPGTPAAAEEPLFWSYCGSTHEDRRDWVQPVKVGFEQENFMGMTASDYGG